MRWLRYEADGRESYGIIEGDEVVEVKGDPFAGYERTATRRKLDAVKFLVPVIPKTFYAAGLNYAEHVTEMAKKRGEEPKLPPEADIGYRANNALIAHGENIVIPKDAGELVQYEAELVAVIGKQVEEPVRERRAVLRARLDDRQRHERAHLAARRPHPVARQEHRHVQADGAVDRDRFRPRRGRDDRAGQRRGHRPFPHQPHDPRRREIPRRGCRNT